MVLSSLLQWLRHFAKPIAWQVESEPGAHQYLHGLRGVLAISSLFWIFFQTFVPALVTDHTAGPSYQRILRIILSPVLWNETLISSFFLALSARSICIRFLNQPPRTKAFAYAGSIIRRTVRMSIVVSLASVLVMGIFKGMGTLYVRSLVVELPNRSIFIPEVPTDILTALNAMFDMFWIVRGYHSQALNSFWPSQTIWNLSLIYQQSWTVYFLMIILPYTRASWHRPFLILFALGSLWMNSWGYYCASALLLADYVIHPELRKRLDKGLTISDNWTAPYAGLSVIMIVLGWVMKLLWTVFPQYIHRELVLHPYLNLAENTTRAQHAAADPYPRVDNYLIIFGVLLLTETNSRVRQALSAKWLVFLGVRSLSLFVTQSIVFWTAGIKIFLLLHTHHGLNTPTANMVVLVSSTIITIVFAELFYRIIDVPSQRTARWAYAWLLR